MNLVGKIFVVLIFVMSLVFMAFSVAVFATHKNWRDVVLNDAEAPGKPLGLKYELEQLDSQLKDVQSQRLKLETELANEKASRERATSKMATELNAVRLDYVRLQNDEAKRETQLNEAVATMAQTQETLKNLRDEITNLRTAGDTARKQRDEAMASSIALEDQLAQQKGELERLEKRETQLTVQVASLETLRQDARLPTTLGTPRVEGLVTDSSGDELVELSIGSDDGLAIGHELDVFRLGSGANSSKYLGRVRVVRTEADRSVAQIIPELRKGAIQKDDHVSTKLR